MTTVKREHVSCDHDDCDEVLAVPAADVLPLLNGGWVRWRYAIWISQAAVAKVDIDLCPKHAANPPGRVSRTCAHESRVDMLRPEGVGVGEVAVPVALLKALMKSYQEAIRKPVALPDMDDNQLDNRARMMTYDLLEGLAKRHGVFDVDGLLEAALEVAVK